VTVAVLSGGNVGPGNERDETVVSRSIPRG